MQWRGTARVASWFGPIILIWFATLGTIGVVCIVEEPSVLAAFNPGYGVTFLLTNGFVGLTVLGLVFLAVTGAEALYADLGHFGRLPIQAAWFAVALPALTLNYLGQGALVLGRPTAIENPFFLMYPNWALWPLVLLSTAATSSPVRLSLQVPIRSHGRPSSSGFCLVSPFATPLEKCPGRFMWRVSTGCY